MKRSVSVGSHHEGDAIVRALDDPATRALVVVMGILQQLPSDRARARVLAHVSDMLDDANSDLGPRQRPLDLRHAGNAVRDEDLDADLRLGHLAGRSSE